MEALDHHHHGSALTAQSSVNEHGWQVLWTKAFPTLLAFDVYCHQDSAPLYLRRIAYHSIIDYLNQNPSRPIQEDSIKDWSASLGYGEITCDTVFQIITWLQENRHDFFPSTVVDLGSGNGRVLLASSVAFQFKNLLGIEILPHLHQDALKLWNVWKEHCPWHLQQMNFELADFTLDHTRIHSADFIWIHATVFEPRLMIELQSICKGCKSGTYFVLVSQPLNIDCDIVTHLECLMPMSWGKARVFIQQKL